MIEPLELRTLLSAPSFTHSGSSVTPTQVTAHRKAHPAIAQKSYVIAFYGLGGRGFDNGWVTTIADTAGKNTHSTVRKYQEDEGKEALADYLESADENGDHVLSAAEIDATTLRVVGFSFGGVQASEFSRSLTTTRKPVLGYKLAKAVPIRSLVAIDPVNTTSFKHTNGPVGNVQNFFSYYELNPGRTSVELLNRTTRQHAGSINEGDALNPVGGPLPSAAQHSSQTFVTLSWSSRRVTQYFNKRFYGSMVGSAVNHTTMPWYLFSTAVQNLGI